MNFIEAMKVADANQHLIGKSWKGATIEEIIIVPTDPIQSEEFSRMYIQTLDAQQSIVPYMNSDVDVFVVCDKQQIRTQKFLICTSICNFPEKDNAIIKAF